MKLQGRVALVTGGGRGIGRGIAMRLAEEGCDVAVVDIVQDNAQKVADEVKALGRRAVAIATDVTKWNQVQDMVTQTVNKLGSLDIACNNAGTLHQSSVEDMPEEAWDLVMNVNLKAVMLCCKAEIPAMKKQKWGRIINTASIAGKVGFPDLSHYSASKYAVVGFTNALAKEMGRDRSGITANCICPGIVGTGMWLGANGMAEKWKMPGETEEQSWKRHQEALIPQGEAQTPEDMGELAVFYALSPHVTGQAINVDGGFASH